MAVTRAFTTSQLDSRVDFYYTATSGQTTFSGSDDNGSTLSYTASGKKDVYLNGTLLIESDDYVATNGTSVVLQATTQAGDILHISVNKVMSNLVNLVDTSVDLNGNELILDADGDTSITADTDDRIDIKIGGTDRVHIDSSGNITPTGIYLGGTGSANLLTDYEEGTFTPTLIERSGATQNTITDATFNGTFHGGSYTKIGNMVNVRGVFRLTSLGSFTSGYEFRMGGLPFSTPALSPQYGEQRAVASIAPFAGIDSIASDAYLIATISAEQDYFSFFSYDNSAGSSSPVNGVTNIQSDCYFNFSCTYRTEE